jgi:hypothetical protein
MPNTFRFTPGASQDNTFRTVTQDVLTHTYASTLAVVPHEQVTLIKVGQLTGAITITANVASLYIGDIVRFLFSSDSTNRIVTFSTGFNTSGTMTVTASKFGYTEFMFNGTSLQETGRIVTA